MCLDAGHSVVGVTTFCMPEVLVMVEADMIIAGVHWQQMKGSTVAVRNLKRFVAGIHDLLGGRRPSGFAPGAGSESDVGGDLRR